MGHSALYDRQRFLGTLIDYLYSDMGFPTEYIEEVLGASTYVENILTGGSTLLYYPRSEFCIKMFQNEIGEQYDFPPHDDDFYADTSAYWSGYIIAYIVYMTGVSDLNRIFEVIPLSQMFTDAIAYHMADERRYVRHFLKLLDDPEATKTFEENNPN